MSDRPLTVGGIVDALSQCDLSPKQLEMLRGIIDQRLESNVEIKSDRELLQEMEALVQTAIDNGKPTYDGWSFDNPAFKDIWDSFWEIKKQIKTVVDWYDPDTTYEEDIMAYLVAAREQIK